MAKPPKTDKSSKKQQQNNETRPDSTIIAAATTTTTTTKTTKSSEKPREIDSSLFRGLDPERISTELSEKYKSMTVKGTQVELNQPDVELFVEKTAALVEAPIKAVVLAAEKEAKEAKETKEADAQKKEETSVVVIDFPTIIDIDRPRGEVNYKQKNDIFLTKITK